ncbi:MAG: V-type ATPase subunit [Actinobacteria bacterium]|nr:V-type ATPase subunit [Actinomycetota bacterium]
MNIEPDMTRAMKTFSRVTRYGHPAGRIMYREGSQLNWQRIERLLESDFGGCIGILRETSYGPYLETATVSREVEVGLQKFLRDEYEFIDDVCAGTRVAEYLHLKYDFLNLKTVLKENYFNTGNPDMGTDLGSIDIERIRSSLEKPHAGSLPDYWEGVIQDIKRKLIEYGEEPHILDAYSDKLYLERRLETADAERSRHLVNFSRAGIDVANLKIIIRGRWVNRGGDYFRKVLAEGGRLDPKLLADLGTEPRERLITTMLAGKYGRMLSKVLRADEKKARLDELDRATDLYLLEEMERFKRVTVGPERIIKYMIRREVEVGLIRIILMGKLHKLSAASIEERLTPAYLSGEA